MLRDKVIGGVKWTSIATLIVAFLHLLKLSVLSRFLEGGQLGQFAIVMVVFGFVNLVSDMGMGAAILHKEKIFRKQYSSLFWLNFLLCFMLYFLLILLSNWFSSFYSEPVVGELLPLAGICVIFLGFGKQFRIIEQKKLNFKKIAIVEVLSSVFSFVLSIVLIMAGFEVYSLVYSLVVQYFISNAIFFYYGMRGGGIAFYFSWKSISKMIRVGFYQMLSELVNFFGKEADIFIVGKFLGMEVLGGYSLAKQLVFGPSMVVNAVVGRVITPFFSLFQSSKCELRAEYLTLSKGVNTINFTIYFLLFFFSDYVALVFFGDKYLYISELISVLSIFMVFRSTGSLNGGVVVALGRTDLGFVWNIFSSFFLIVVMLFGAQINIFIFCVLLVFGMVSLYFLYWRFVVRVLLGIDFGSYFLLLLPRLMVFKWFFLKLFSLYSKISHDIKPKK